MISELLKQIRERMFQAALKAGRRPTDVALVAVTKGQPIGKIRQAFEAGQRDFGENYAQEFLEHASSFKANWHFIGHLQRNKVKSVIEGVSLIHSVDSLALAQEIDKRAAAIGKIQPVLIEVNLGGEVSKSGLGPDEAPRLAGQMKALEHLDLQGLMTIPPQDAEPRAHFRRLREIRDAINAQNVYKHPLSELSMGMTHDFEAAIEEGATIVRIGTGIFGEREKKE